MNAGFARARRHLCFRATNRVVRDFEWGLEWTRDWPCAQLHPKNGEAPEDYVAHLNHLAMQDSDEFYGYERPRDFELRDGMLRFHSPVRTPYEENNLVHAQWFPAANPKRSEESRGRCCRTGTLPPTATTRCAAGWRAWAFPRCASACLITITACRRN